jgi:DNA-binding LytR/AlgR family response regulator
MNILIVEDEIPAAKRLMSIAQKIDSSIHFVKHTDSIESTIAFLKTNPQIDLIFMDIQLADGISFDIFNQIAIETPVIFTTAFDQFTLKAFKVNSIDYLLKPINEIELSKAIVKYKNIYHDKVADFSSKVKQVLSEMNQQLYKERLLIKRGQQLSYLKVSNLAFAYADGKLCFAIDFNNNKYLLEHNLTQLEDTLQPSNFYRINRNVVINIEAIAKVHTWLGGRLKVETIPNTTIETVVSRERVQTFKEWLGT